MPNPTYLIPKDIYDKIPEGAVKIEATVRGTAKENQYKMASIYAKIGCIVVVNPEVGQVFCKNKLITPSSGNSMNTSLISFIEDYKDKTKITFHTTVSGLSNESANKVVEFPKNALLDYDVLFQYHVRQVLKLESETLTFSK